MATLDNAAKEKGQFYYSTICLFHGIKAISEFTFIQYFACK